MIINDTHQFVFIHIPKCAGTTARNVLRTYDQTNGAYAVRTAHPNLGHIDYGHIPLFILREHFHEEYEKLRYYKAYAVIRDPFSRFPSSLSAHMRMYGKRHIREMGLRDIRATVDRVLHSLRDYKQPDSYLPYQHIHFQRQVDFVYDEGERLVEHIYTTDRIGSMLADIGTHMGIPLIADAGAPVSKANETVFYRNALLRAMIEPAKPALKILLSPERRRTLKQATKDWVFVSSDRKLKKIFESDHVRDFIADYYREDIRLFQEVRESEKRQASMGVSATPRETMDGHRP